ncbi:MAG: hypothetical protein EON87_07285 [Brevundimonas sp.]|nr:MAG: hypothetical protein EON87_07285 [Brevundimonas sp.]
MSLTDPAREMGEEQNSEPRIRAKITNEIVDYPHNDLASAAWFYRERLTKAFEDKARNDGIFLDMIALVTMTAFALEGYTNFVGERVLSGGAQGQENAWDDLERKPVKDKLKAIRKVLGFEIDWNKRPYQTVDELIDLRNMFAHPKAHRAEEREHIRVGTDSELRQMLRDHRPAYEKQLTWEFANIAYEDVETIWKDLLAVAKIEIHETWSGGSQGIELIEVLDGRDN